MSQDELYSELVSTGYPVNYHHFTEQENPPYIVYLYTTSDDFMADNINYQSIDNYQVELYTFNKNLAAEKKVEDVLKKNKLPYTKFEAWIDSEKLYQMVYVIQI